MSVISDDPPHTWRSIVRKNSIRTFEAPTSAIVLDLVRMRRSVSSLLRKGGAVFGLLDMVANAVVAILQRILVIQVQYM